jgi:hypothetical protein
MIDVKEFIQALGGTKKVSVKLKLTSPSVSEWIKDESIPPGRLVKLAVWAEKLGIASRSDIFPTEYGDIWPELEGQPPVNLWKSQETKDK